MNREIKFRAWVPGYEDDPKFYMYPVTKLETEKDSWDEYSIEIFDGYNYMSIEKTGAKLMQYTGLKDKNDKEIYEGDVLNGDVWNGVVLFNEGRFVIDESKAKMFIPVRDVMHRNFVIGNIYENPELLKSI